MIFPSGNSIFKNCLFHLYKIDKDSFRRSKLLYVVCWGNKQDFIKPLKSKWGWNLSMIKLSSFWWQISNWFLLESFKSVNSFLLFLFVFGCRPTHWSKALFFFAEIVHWLFSEISCLPIQLSFEVSPPKDTFLSLIFPFLPTSLI